MVVAVGPEKCNSCRDFILCCEQGFCVKAVVKSVADADDDVDDGFTMNDELPGDRIVRNNFEEIKVTL